MSARISINGRQQRDAFTLVELMAVVLVIIMLVGIVLGVSTYTHKKSFTFRARSEIAAMELALDQYKADFGYYPVTQSIRISRQGAAELTNSFVLAKALTGATGVDANGNIVFSSAKQYVKLSPQTLRVFSAVYWNGSTFTNVLTLPAIVDPFGKPYNYYCSPTTALVVSNGFWTSGGAVCHPSADGHIYGGQVNVLSYDLWSYGPDLATSYPTNYSATILQAWGKNGAFPNGAQGAEGWMSSNPGGDDITNFGK